MSPSLARSLYAAAAMAVVAAGTAVLKPAPAEPTAAPDLAAMTPIAFGGWTAAPLDHLVAPQEGDTKNALYRAYADRYGRIVTMVLAYGPPQGDAVRLHRPEICYVSQGYAITLRGVDTSGAAPVVEFKAANHARREAVSYVLRDGDAFTTHSADAQLNALRDIGGAPTDGALLRISSSGDAASQFELNRRFIEDLEAAAPANLRALVFGRSDQ
jgi:EpsI family protein